MLRLKNIAIVSFVFVVLFSVSKTAAGGTSGANLVNMLPSWLSQWFFQIQPCGFTDDGMGGLKCGGSCPQGQRCGIDPNGNPFGPSCGCAEGLPTTPPAQCGMYEEENQDGATSFKCGGACPAGQHCGNGPNGNPFGGLNCECVEALPTEPPAQCGQYEQENKDGTTSFQCGGACPAGETCGRMGGNPFSIGGCGCVEAIPTTPPAQCGMYEQENPDGTVSFKCGGACPQGQTCMVGQGFVFSCACGTASSSSAPAVTTCGTTAPLCNGPCPVGEICAGKADDGTGRGSTCECVQMQTETMPLMR